jgi:hypothetical protein
MESLLSDEEVWLARLESRLKRAINFDMTVGSRSNFYMSLWRLFSFGLLWNRYSRTWRSCRPCLSNSSKGPQLSIRLLDRAQMFTLVSGGHFPWGSYEITTRWWGDLVGQTWVTAQNGNNFWSEWWIAFKLLHEFTQAVSIVVVMELLLGEEEVWSARLE